MAFDRKAYQKKYTAEWYKKNKKSVIKRSKESNKLNSKRNQDFVRQIKESNPCKDCGVKYPHYIMDFDHLTNDKMYEVGNMTSHAFSIETIQKEIDKCDLLCSNCHRARTWKRLHNGPVVQLVE